MIESIDALNWFGLFKQATPNGQIQLSKLTLVYGENGRGKSTIADLFRYFGLQDSPAVISRKNWGGAQSPLIKITYAGTQQVFANDIWQNPNPRKIAVFDQKFVDSNVHSGHNISPDHRKSLHQFVLGEESVKLQKSYDAATEAEKVARDQLAMVESKLRAIFPNLTVAQVQAIVKRDSVDDAISASTKKVAEAQLIDQTLKRLVPSTVTWTTLKLDTFWSILGQTLTNVSAEADKLVKEHLVSLHGDDSETWISAGMTHLLDETCPFCAQSVSGLNLVEAYKSYFDAAYIELKEKAQKLVTTVQGLDHQSQIERIDGICKNNLVAKEQWKEIVDFDLPQFDLDSFQGKSNAVIASLLGLAVQKAAQPLEPITGNHAARIEAELRSMGEMGQAYNAAILIIQATLTKYKETLKAANFPALERELLNLKHQKRRFEADAIALLEDAATKKIALQVAAKLKSESKAKLDSEMIATLAILEAEINLLLQRFGASFRIKECQSTNLGAGAAKRVEYVLQFDNAAIGVLGQANSEPGKSFGEALSEGDKRTLALTFYLARLRKDVNLADTVVVLDDPICSLGDHRRSATLEVIRDLYPACQQLILLCHDRFFIRETRDFMSYSLANPTVFEMKNVGATGLTFVPADIDSLCESKYRRDYKMVKAFANSSGVGDAEKVAQGLRIVLEGYMNRKFVGDFANAHGVGDMITTLKSQTPPHVFVGDAAHVQEWRDLNTYALKFHHDGSAKWKSPTINNTEILVYAQRTLRIVQK